MANYKYRDGLGSVGAYQASSRPYLSSSINVPAGGAVVQISFPSVTKFITVKNTIDPTATNVKMRVGFSELGIAASNYFILEQDESFSADWRVNAVFLRVDDVASVLNATASVIAGETSIGSGELVGNWSGSIGVG